MARIVPPTKVVSLSKSVQQMSIDDDEPPQQYIIKESSVESIESSPPLVPIPIIDISLLSSSSSSLSSKEEDNEVEKLRSVLSSFGCFQAIGHGIPSSFLDKVHEVAKQFFALPPEEKRKYARTVDAEGYGSDSIVSEKQVLDWSDRLSLKVFPQDERRLNLWPDNPNDLREILHEYATKIKFIMDFLLKVMAKSLNLAENSFLDQFGNRALIQARFNFYSRCRRPDLVLGLKAHSDKSGITVLLQDKEVEGLQIFKDGRWIKVPIIPHALLVNLGDQMEIMSNGIFKSPLHRVAANSQRERISLAVFYSPEPEKEIEPAEGLIDEKRPQLYRKVKNYGAINFECFQNGKIAIDTVKI